MYLLRTIFLVIRKNHCKTKKQQQPQQKKWRIHTSVTSKMMIGAFVDNRCFCLSKLTDVFFSIYSYTHNIIHYFLGYQKNVDNTSLQMLSLSL